MENKISYDLEVEFKKHKANLESFNSQLPWKRYTPDFKALISEAVVKYRIYKFSNVITCLQSALKILFTYNKMNYKDEVIEGERLINEVVNFCKAMIDNGFDNYNEEEIELTEKDKMKLQKQKADFRLKEIQEEKAPYLNLSLSIVFILMSVIFVFIPNYFNNSTLLYHICGFMFFFGFLFAKQEIELRNKIGFVTQSEKLTTKRAFISLVQAVVYMIPLAVLSIFFYELLFIRILLFVQIWFCAVLLLNGILILTVHSYVNKKMEKFSIWGFILGAISIIGFVIQILQLFNVL